MGPRKSATDLGCPEYTGCHEDQARTPLKFIDTLEENDDVQSLSFNFEISDEISDKAEGKDNADHGIDPDFRQQDGVIAPKGAQLRSVDHGIIRTTTRMNDPERLDQIFEGLRMITNYQPEIAIIEEIFVKITRDPLCVWVGTRRCYWRVDRHGCHYPKFLHAR